MVKSMTGYGRAEATQNGLDICVEIKSVNHRYLEFTPKVPRSLIFLEDKLKALVSSKISRGKVDLFLTINSQDIGNTEVDINRSFADPYIKALKQLSKEYKVKNDISVSLLAKNQDIFTIKKSNLDEEYVLNNVLSVASLALENFVAMRQTEGEKLKNDVLSRIEFIKNKVSFIEERSPNTVKEYRIKLEERMRELLGDVQIDEQRLITETGIMADKLAVCEETVRLRSHMEQLSNMFNLNEPIGRKLDFIVQEMNRETNTIGSKAQDIEITSAVVEIKSEIEKIREQIQNIE